MAPPSQVRSMVQGKTLGGDFQFSADDADGSVLGDRSAGQDGRIVVSSARGGEPALHRPNHPMHFQHLRADGEWSEFDEDSTAFRVANPIGQQAPSL